jgi:hypothetical protein
MMERRGRPRRFPSWPITRDASSSSGGTMRHKKSKSLKKEGAAEGSLVGFLVCHCLAGISAGWTVVGGLLWLDVGGLAGLVMTSDLFPVPLLMLLAAFAITFGSVAMGSAIMGLGRSAGPASLAGRRSLRPPPGAARNTGFPA